MSRFVWIGLCLMAACGGSSIDPKDDPGAVKDPAPDSSTWFRHAEDNSKFIERYNALHDSTGAPKDTEVIYTDTWTGHGTFDFSDSTATDSAVTDSVERR